MSNPFETIDKRLTNIESLLLELKHPSIPKQTPEPDKQPRFITRQDTAKLLGVSLVTIDKWSNEGYLKKYRIGGRIRFKAAEVQKALSEVKDLKYKR
jgi:excisionase family DNA binding protein